MQTITLQVKDHIYEKFFWLLNHFSKNEIKILEQSKYISDDEYLRSIDGMVKSIQEARKEPIENGVTLDMLDW
ncbi:Antitoxin [Candidatus Magnetomoraceae bacterium gMMP-15]